MDRDEEIYALEARPLPPKALLARLAEDDFLLHLGRGIYGNMDPDYLKAQQARFVDTVKAHQAQYGDSPILLMRAPGRLNLFIEYLDMCRGDHMSTTIDGDIPMAMSAAEEGSDRVRVFNSNPLFASGEFSLSRELAQFMEAPCPGSADEEGQAEGVEAGRAQAEKAQAEFAQAEWAKRTWRHPHYKRERGDPLNYVLAPFLRMAFEMPGKALAGCDLTFGPSTIPLRAGTSSSSAVVVLSLLALLAANREVLPPLGVRTLCRLLGEAEWYVGTRGGANDQTTIFRNEMGGILYNLHHLELIDSRPLPWLADMSVIVCNSLWEADKALGARYVFNMRKGWIDLARDIFDHILSAVHAYRAAGLSTAPGWLSQLLDQILPGFSRTESKRCDDRPDRLDARPERLGTGPDRLDAQPELWDQLQERFCHLGSLDEELMGLDAELIREFIDLMPEFVTPEEACRILSKERGDLEQAYTLPNPEDGGYRPRQAARFFFEENLIGRSLERLLLEARLRVDKDGLATDSAAYEGYREKVASHLNRLQEVLRDLLQVSNSQLELLIDVASKGPGFMAAKLTGAGSGGCVCILARKESAPAMLQWLDREYFGKLENFKAYNETLDELASTSEEAGRWKAQEMRSNLLQALDDPRAHRRVVTFSQGAGLLF